MYQFSDKTDNFGFSGLNLLKNGIWGRNFKNLSLHLESTSPIHRACQVFLKKDNFSFFSVNLGKLPNCGQYFSPNIVDSIAERWVEAEMSWVEVEGTGWRLK